MLLDRICVTALLLFSLAGCNQSKISSLEAQVMELQHSLDEKQSKVELLEEKLEKAKKHSDAINDTFSEIQSLSSDLNVTSVLFSNDVSHTKYQVMDISIKLELAAEDLEANITELKDALE